MNRLKSCLVSFWQCPGGRWRAGIGLIAVALVATVAVTGCGSSSSSSGEGQVAYSTTKLLEVYTVTMSDLVQKDAKQMGMDMLPTVDSNAEAAKQVTDFNTLLGEGVKGILVTADDGRAIKPALDQAEAKHVPVVSIDTGPDPGDGKVAMAVRVSGIAMGEEACEVIGELTGGHGTALELQGALTNPAGIERSKGFEDCMKEKFPQVKIIAKPANFVQQEATEATQAVLTTSEVNAMFLASDSAYLPGVVNVMKQLGKLKKVGEPGHIGIVTIDGSPYALNQVRAGSVDDVISQPLGNFVKYGLEYLKGAMSGKTYKPGPTDHDSTIIETDGLLQDVLKATLVTKKNVNSPELWGNQSSSE